MKGLHKYSIQFVCRGCWLLIFYLDIFRIMVKEESVYEMDEIVVYSNNIDIFYMRHRVYNTTRHDNDTSLIALKEQREQLLQHKELPFVYHIRRDSYQKHIKLLQ